jgi:hypothetical protein
MKKNNFIHTLSFPYNPTPFPENPPPQTKKNKKQHKEHFSIT